MPIAAPALAPINASSESHHNNRLHAAGWLRSTIG